MEQYVCLRITRMDDVDVALFDRDWNNTLYFFMLNADQQIYMRYGGRDSASADTYLNLDSLELALSKGLELHKQYLAGELPKTERPKPVYPREFPLLVERTFARNACVECHLIGDFRNMHKEQDGTLNKLTDLWRSPDIKTIGIHLDVPKGLVLKEAQGAVLEAGMRPGDRIAAVNATTVWTFADLQHYYDKTPRGAKQVRMTVERAGQLQDLAIHLPKRWWWYDTRFRQSTVEPRLYFDGTPLTEEEKQKFGLKPEGLATRVKYVDEFAKMMKSHELRVGDIVFGVDGVEQDDLAHTADLYVKIRRNAGDTVTLDVLRDGKRFKSQLRTYRMAFRK
jgi:serine protease Do